MQIYPSILELSKEAFEAQFERVLPHFPHFQIDIADGILVPNRTVQIEEMMKVINNSQFSIYNKSFEFHLMVCDWEKEIEKLEKTKISHKITIVLIHLAALKLDSSVTSFPQTLALETQGSRDDKGWKYGFVLNPEDDIDKNWEILKTVDTIQIMTIHQGAQGRPFIPETLTKIDQLREAGFSGKIILDGGINDQTLPLIMERERLPDAVCPGSYFTKDVAERLEKLTKISQIS